MRKIATTMHPLLTAPSSFIRTLYSVLSTPFSVLRYLFSALWLLSAFCFLLTLSSCKQKQAQQEYTPWGTPLDKPADGSSGQTTPMLSLSDIIAQGELIMLTINGPETYYDYHGHGMGLHFMLCENFAQRIGVKLRVEQCRDTAELTRRLIHGDGDIIACPVKSTPPLISCGPQWAVLESNTSLYEEVKKWYTPDLLSKTKAQQQQLLSSGGVTRHVYAPMINRQKGLISQWDHLFRKHAPTARLDWRLLAAQCYQESCFDPKARSWAGACGLMQIMPATAKQLGLAQADIYHPEKNIAAAAKYMNQLMHEFRDIPTQHDRLCFALASYNGGSFHVRDAMALAKKYGHSPQHWGDVRQYILKLTDAKYYTDPVVKYGYMRGTETSAYVDRIIARWAEYGGRPGRTRTTTPGTYTGPSTQPTITNDAAPRPAKKTNRYRIKGDK